jgi:hypothetical protein
MFRPRRLLLALALLGVMLVGFTGVCRHRGGAPRWPAAEGPEVEEARMERRLQVALRRITAKRKVVRALVAGRLTLTEAAGLFRRLNEEPPDCPCQNSCLWPHASPGERLYRQVIEWARAEARGQKTSAAMQRFAQLEGELHALLARKGGAPLPEAPRDGQQWE